jgi:hypothetical protein
MLVVLLDHERSALVTPPVCQLVSWFDRSISGSEVDSAQPGATGSETSYGSVPGAARAGVAARAAAEQVAVVRRGADARPRGVEGVVQALVGRDDRLGDAAGGRALRELATDAGTVR